MAPSFTRRKLLRALQGVVHVLSLMCAFKGAAADPTLLCWHANGPADLVDSLIPREFEPSYAAAAYCRSNSEVTAYRVRKSFGISGRSATVQEKTSFINRLQVSLLEVILFRLFSGTLFD
jgi:hypothetical protein